MSSKFSDYELFVGIFLVVVGLYYPIILNVLSNPATIGITIVAFVITSVLSVILMFVIGWAYQKIIQAPNKPDKIS